MSDLQIESTPTSPRTPPATPPRTCGLKLYLHKNRLYNIPQTANAKKADCRNNVPKPQGQGEIEGQNKGTKGPMTSKNKQKKK